MKGWDIAAATGTQRLLESTPSCQDELPASISFAGCVRRHPCRPGFEHSVLERRNRGVWLTEVRLTFFKELSDQTQIITNEFVTWRLSGYFATEGRALPSVANGSVLWRPPPGPLQGCKSKRLGLKRPFAFLCPGSPGLAPRSQLSYLLIDCLVRGEVCASR